MNVFHRPLNLLVYTGAAVLWVAAVILDTNWTAAVAVVGFLGWDLAFLLSRDAYMGRDPANLVAQAHHAREHVSYFLPFYGVLFGYLFASGPESRQAFVDLLARAGISGTLLLLPILFASTAILFIPIQISTDANTTTRSAKALFFVTSFCQKCAIFLFVHAALRLFAVTAGP